MSATTTATTELSSSPPSVKKSRFGRMGTVLRRQSTDNVIPRVPSASSLTFNPSTPPQTSTAGADSDTASINSKTSTKSSKWTSRAGKVLRRGSDIRSSSEIERDTDSTSIKDKETSKWGKFPTALRRGSTSRRFSTTAATDSTEPSPSASNVELASSVITPPTEATTSPAPAPVKGIAKLDTAPATLTPPPGIWSYMPSPIAESPMREAAEREKEAEERARVGPSPLAGGEVISASPVEESEVVSASPVEEAAPVVETPAPAVEAAVIPAAEEVAAVPAVAEVLVAAAPVVQEPSPIPQIIETAPSIAEEAPTSVEEPETVLQEVKTQIEEQAPTFVPVAASLPETIVTAAPAAIPTFSLNEAGDYSAQVWGEDVPREQAPQLATKSSHESLGWVTIQKEEAPKAKEEQEQKSEPIETSAEVQPETKEIPAPVEVAPAPEPTAPHGQSYEPSIIAPALAEAMQRDIPMRPLSPSPKSTLSPAELTTANTEGDTQKPLPVGRPLGWGDYAIVAVFGTLTSIWAMAKMALRTRRR